MSTKKKDLKDLVVGDKVVLVKTPSSSYYGHGYEVGTVFTVAKDSNPFYGVLVKDVLFSGETADRYINFAFIEHYVEGEEEKNMFTKNDLKTGMWVEFRNGEIGVVVEVDKVKYIMSPDTPTCITKIDESYNDSLQKQYNQTSYDIVKVWNPNSNCNYLLTHPGRIRWVAPKPPVKTEQELAHEKLMSQIAELEEKTKELREQAKKLGETK